MNRHLGIAAGALVVLASAGASLADETRVIVVFKSAVDESAVERQGGTAGRALPNQRALSARLPASRIAALRADPAVSYVEEDGIAEALKGKPAPSQPKQSTPWGVSKVGAPVDGNTGADVMVAVIDTGIDLNHPDLGDHLGTGKNLVDTTKNPEDDNGHGSHVAGTIGAIDNSIGVVGVAPDATLYPVKVLDRRGSGWWSDVAAGIDWAADNGMHIANMSIGGGYSSTVETACDDAETAGVLLLAAAGNEGDGDDSTDETSYPAAFDSVVAVGATTSGDGLASFSNTGDFVEVCAPGVSVPSTYKGDGYATMSGTSMACPHAAGMAALLWQEILDAGGTPDAATVRTELQERVVDLGDTGRDKAFGFGRVAY
jgi:subtilisin family serine protease